MPAFLLRVTLMFPCSRGLVSNDISPRPDYSRFSPVPRRGFLVPRQRVIAIQVQGAGHFLQASHSDPETHKRGACCSSTRPVTIRISSPARRVLLAPTTGVTLPCQVPSGRFFSKGHDTVAFHAGIALAFFSTITGNPLPSAVSSCASSDRPNQFRCPDPWRLSSLYADQRYPVLQ